MRKYQQEQLLELIKILKEGDLEFARLDPESESDRFIANLAECQDCAIQIAQFIESIEGEGTATVALLEEFCEMLYWASVEINRGANNLPFIARLRNQFSKIEKSVQDEFKQTKIEIAFFVHKASMWDSCESVWRAANDDLLCDAVVVPIPYFDRMANGALGQMHEEGELFPDYVPIVDWRQYNLEQRRPDIAVTINPYDDQNTVTMVHPEFFTSRLKTFTKLLVYIPYFVTFDDLAEYFCISIGVLNADRVFVQSDPIRETYIRVLKKFQQMNQVVGHFGPVEGKIVALGSPKFDKVVNTRREDCHLPDEWRLKIEKPDGTQKKIILYNTSISSILEGGVNVLHKLRQVFEYVRKRDDVVLLWRPHPLHQSTYQSMRPHLLKEYQELIEYYKRERIGIYDDTADLHRAIASSDAYYGDWGSLIALYACTGKPILLQSLRPSVRTTRKLLVNTIHDDDDDYWCSVYDCNALFRIDKKTRIAEYMGSFPKENGPHLYIDVVEQNGKLYFSPFNADQIAVYDKKIGRFERVPLKPQAKLKWLRPGTNRYFTRIVQYMRFLFFVGNVYPAIVRYDSVSGEMIYCTDWVRHLEQAAEQSPHWLKWDQTHDFNALLRPGQEVVGSEIALNLFVSNEIMFFNLETLTHQFYKIGKEDERFYGVCYDGEHYWLASRTGNYIVKWKRETQAYEKFEFPPYFETGHAINFQALLYHDGYVWLIPYEANAALKLDIKNHRFHQASEFDQPVTREAFMYMNVKQSNETVYALTNDHVLQWDKKKQQFTPHEFFLSDSSAGRLIDLRLEALRMQRMQFKNRMDTIHREPLINLDTFIHFVTQGNTVSVASCSSDQQIELCNEMANRLDGTCGKAIHECMMQSLHVVAGGK